MQKISTICSAFNSLNKINILIKSFKNQDYENKELIIVDGSKGRKKFDELNNLFAEENLIKLFYLSNTSIYECLNFGIQNSSGDIINIMGDDDYYSGPNTFRDVANEFEKNIDFLYGDTLYKTNEKTIRYYKSFDIKKKLMSIAYMPSHTSLFIKKNVYNKIGLYNTSFKIASDLEFFFRLIKNEEFKYVYKNEAISIMSAGGKSNKSLKNIVVSNIEAIQILKNNNYNFAIIRIIIKLIFKLFLLITLKTK